jgi:hypothetical protein
MPTAEFANLINGQVEQTATGRWGIASIKPPGDYVLVMTTARHRYMEPTRGINELVVPGMMYWMETHRVRGNVAAGLVHPAPKTTHDWWGMEGRVLGVEADTMPAPRCLSETAGALKIVSGCSYDPGSAAFRFHSAVNEHTKHAMAFVRWGDTNPHCSLRQYDAQADAYAVRDAVMTADVIHNHVAYYLLNNTGLQPRPDQLIARHYHGSVQGGRTNLEPIFDTSKQAIVFGARLQLCEEGRQFDLPMRWSPIPMPVARYRQLRDRVRLSHNWEPLEGEATPARPFRVSHTPTNTRLKGSDAFRAAVLRLQQRGVPIEMDLIQNVSLRQALERQALTDCCFDSFWLGMQGSGLQMAAMEQPVVAGDAENREIYQRRIGSVPYTFADDEQTLSKQLERLAMDPAYRAKEAARVATYCERYHDYSAVAMRYEHDLAEVLGRKDVLTDAKRARALPPLKD